MAIDQYGNAVAADLEVVPDFTLLSPEERAEIFPADWYESDGILLFVPCNLSGDDPRDCGLAVDEDGNIKGEIAKVDDCLKRGSEADGFYHA